MMLGTLRLHESAEADALLGAGLPLDTADVYGSAAGEAHQRIGAPAQTKVGLVRKPGRWMPKGTAKYLRSQVEASREVLGRLPAVLLHAVDPSVGLEKSWKTLQKLRSEGLTERIGVCNLRVHEVRALLELGGLDIVQVALSPFALGPLENGLVRICREAGVEVQAHSPLGGHRRKRRVVKSWSKICATHDISHERLTLRWLESLGVVPVVGCTRMQTLEDARGAVPDAALRDAREALPATRWATEVPRVSGAEGEVVLIAGLPASGKTTAARPFIDRGWHRLNRDERGGTMKGLLKQLAVDLESHADVVLDNTWSERSTRHRAVVTAQAHRRRIRLLHQNTPLEQCLVQAVRRILADGRGLPEPHALNGKPVHWFPPSALFNHAARWEPPTPDEGFEIEVLPAPVLSWGEGSGTIVNLAALEAGVMEPVYAALWAPDAERRERIERALQHNPVIDHRICTHPPGPPSCWCRKPQPGMAVDLMLEHGLDPNKTTFLGGPAERTLALRLGGSFRSL